MGYCNDCGCRTSGGVCSNCHEELYILDNQYEYIERDLSKEFISKAMQQAAKIEAKTRKEGV